MSSKTYQQLSDELNDILNQLQSSESSIDDSVELYERGLKLAQEMELYLNKTSNKMSRLKQKFEA